jgi:alpha-L-rhamnosidase
MVGRLSNSTLLAVVLGFIPLQANAESARFVEAEAIWPEGRQLERNLMVGFRAAIVSNGRQQTVLRLTASTLYRATVNGQFVGYGPARGPHGYFRMDQWDITEHLRDGTNLVVVEVAGYNVNSYYTIDAPSFLQAEVVVDGRVVAATGSDRAPFSAIIMTARVQKVQRYSFQRPFIEVYHLGPGDDQWKTDPGVSLAAEPCATPPGERRLLPRRAPYPRFNQRPPLWHVASGTVQTGVVPERLWKDRSLTHIGPKLGGYPEPELETVLSSQLQTIRSDARSEVNEPVTGEGQFHLDEKEYCILDLGTNLSGFLGATVTCTEKTRLILVFDEILTGGDVDFKRLGCVNAVSYEFEPGHYSVESFEAYTLRYVKLIVLEGACDVGNVTLREYTNPDIWEAQFAASDQRLNRLFEAGRETFRQNAVDLPVDCPSRERAGWLCDSFFTSRVAFDLSGNTSIERCFIENYLLPETFEFLPKGMLPMCYPADHNDGVFIPNWALWFVVELEEYLARSGDRATVDALRQRVLDLFAYFEPFHNDDGLLEKLESWVFVEWSAANQFVQDVNYPTNMLYAAALAAAGRMYDLDRLTDQAKTIRAVVEAQSFDGSYYVDNAVRQDGKLQVTRNRSEVCQYFAFYFGLASPRKHPALWRTIRDQFGPERKTTGALPDIHSANAFVGNMLRMEILSRHGHCRQILDESVDYLMYMAEETGTLWENIESSASCNHGFAAHIVHTLYRDVLGLYRVDQVKKEVHVRLTDVGLQWCKGRVPTADGFVALEWRLQEDAIVMRLERPAGYRVQVQNLSHRPLKRMP